MLTEKQRQLTSLIQTTPNVLGYGGARSGKTYGFLMNIAYFAQTMPGAFFLICRRYSTDIRGSVWNDTLPKIFQSLDLQTGKDFMRIEATMTVTFSNKARIMCAGLDDAERVDKILGQEYFLIYINESQDIPYLTVNKIMTRLAQKNTVAYRDDKGHMKSAIAKNRFFVDLNPTSINHWTYKLFIEKVDPISGNKLNNPDDYVAIQMNPQDNAANLPPDFIENRLGNLVGNMRNRFLLGEYTTDSDIQVFSPRSCYKWDEFVTWVNGRWADVRMVGGLDLGYNDADAFIVLAYIDGDRDVWLVYEHKARRQIIDDLVNAIKQGMEWCWANIPTPVQDFEIYADTATIRHGREGDLKKNASQLAYDYGLPVRPAYKRDKMAAIDHLQAEVNKGFLHIPYNGAFFKETELTVWTKSEDGITIERRIDDEVFHPDMMDAILYAYRYLISYGNSALADSEFGPAKIPEDMTSEFSPVGQMIQALRRDDEVY